jgi:hypothetical protein
LGCQEDTFGNLITMSSHTTTLGIHCRQENQFLN